MSRRASPVQRVSLVLRRRTTYAGPPITDYVTDYVRTTLWMSKQATQGQCYQNPHLSAAHHPSDDGQEQWLTWSHEVRIVTRLHTPWRLTTHRWAPLWRFV